MEGVNNMVECAFNCIETFIGVPKALVDGGMGELFHAYAEMIWNLMGWSSGD